MSEITTKYTSLMQAGVNLGADLHPGVPDMDAGYGGTYRQYQNGNIYFHPGVSPEAHEVHGGILSVYLAHGGPGVDPATGKRLFGFPKSDESQSVNRTPMNSFEWGAIYWTAGTAGVTLTGAAYQTFLNKDGIHVVGLPIASNAAVAGGEAIYCERGIAWATAAVPNGSLLGRLTPPLLGAPLVIDPTPQTQGPINTQAKLVGTVGSGIAVGGNTIQPFLPGVIHFDAIPKDLYGALTKGHPDFFSTLWAGRLSLVNTATRADRSAQVTGRIPLDCVLDTTAMTDTAVNVTCRLAFERSDNAQDSTLYDLDLSIPGSASVYAVSPHCVYLKKDWTDFGLLHVTDLHLSLRNQNLGPRLEALGLHDGASNYTNCQTQFKDFIHYANHLRSLGLAHGVLATGDLVDYIAEPGDDPYGPSNYQRLRNMILGLPFDAGVPAGEELLLPIFTTFGNHDHRLHPYDLHCRLSVQKNLWEAAIVAAHISPAIAVIATLVSLADDVYEYFAGDDNDFLGFDLPQFQTFNLKESEVTQLQGGVPVFSAGDFNTPLQYLKQAATYPYWDKYFGPRNNKVALGPHRLVLLDSGGDSGVPDSAGPADLPGILINYLDGNLPRDTMELTTGAPNSVGYDQSQLDLLHAAQSEAGANGLVIVGVHLPPIAPTKGYNDYFRETEHPTTDPSLINNYLMSTKLAPAGWSVTGSPFFAFGDVSNKLDFGIGTGRAMDFLQLCAGVGAARPIDLLLCGHHHDRIEYRMRWNPSLSHLEYFMDFYSENPVAFSRTTVVSKTERPDPINAGRTIVSYDDIKTRVIVDPAAKLGGEHGVLVYSPGSGQKPVTYQTLRVPPYATPLNASTDAAGWWQAHRPLLMQTAALGPIDPCQRFDDTEDPEPTFQGFRLLQVRANTIQKIRYITMAELRKSNFVLSWESESSPSNRVPVIPVSRTA